jgi:TPP-dependent pyruvate/acetoin dehydrogenase alpha subunit
VPTSKTKNTSTAKPAALSAAELLELYSLMLKTRVFEETILRLYNQGKVVGGAFSGRGNEATSVGSAFALAKTDYLFPMHRDMGAHFARGQSAMNMMLQHLGRDESFARGRDGTGHYSDPTLRIYGNISHLGAMIPVAAGAALASRIKKEDAVALTYIGDGGASVGEVHEGLAFASALRLPLILIIENNQFAYSTPIAKQFIAKKLSDRALGYGIAGVTIDGTDVVAVVKACREAIARARKGDGPTIIESITMRMQGHAAHDNAWYVPKKQLEEWKKKDPLEKLEAALLKSGALTAAKKSAMLKAIETEMDKAAEYAVARPFPSAEDAAKGVFA